MDLTSEMDGVLFITHGLDATFAGEPVTVVPFDPEAETEEIEGTRPSVLIRDTELPVGTLAGSLVVIGTKTYSVCGAEPDGTGMTLVQLEYQSG